MDNRLKFQEQGVEFHFMTAFHLKEVLEKHTREAELYTPLPDQEVRCDACAHECRIKEGGSGICRIRINKKGKLYAPYGYVAGLQPDPIEKKPFFHVFPNSTAVSFGMLGCDFHCDFCQNWITTQTLRDPEAESSIQEIDPDTIVGLALQYQSPLIVSTYNEPLITSEWAVEIFKKAKPHGIRGAYVSNGHATEKVLDYIRPYVDCYKVDLKCFDENNYRKLGGSLTKVLKGIEMVRAKGFWMEIVTLLVPDFNDSDSELKKTAEFIASLSKDIPWHITAFHPDYRMLEHRNTEARDLMRAAAIGKEAGLRFVYAGNLPGLVHGLENTYCPECRALVVERSGFYIAKNRLKDGKCPDCSKVIPGVWK